MAHVERTTSNVVNDYNQLSERYARLLKEKQDLEERKEKVVEIGLGLKDKRHEWQTLGEQLLQLANRRKSSSGEPAGRDVGGAAGNDAADTQSLSLDFGNLGIQEIQSELPGRDEEIVAKVIARFQEHIAAREIDLQLIQKQMEEQVGERRYDKVPRGCSPKQTRSGELVHLNHVSAGGEDVYSSPSTKVRELEKVNDMLNERIEEVLEDAQDLKNRVDVLTRQKEELLQVNHRWDNQYRQLKADKERLASELRAVYRKPESAGVQLQGQNASGNEEDAKVIREMTQKNEALSQELAVYKEKIQKHDQLWLAAKKMISEEREAREAAVQMKQTVEERYKQLETQLEIEKQGQVFLKQEIERLQAIVGSADVAANGPPSMSSSIMAEQIEMLKQQISVYADDFANERSDRERIQTEREAQKERIEEFEKEIPLLKEQVRAYREDFDKERRDKERLQRQLRERNLGQAQDDPWYMVPPNDYVPMHAPAQRRQPYYQERGYRYTPREIQELAFQQQQQQPLHPRGTTGGHPGGLCHGCEADCDVIDGSNVVLKCPRCERVFPSKERRAFDEHIDRCTT